MDISMQLFHHLNVECRLSQRLQCKFLCGSSSALLNNTLYSTFAMACFAVINGLMTLHRRHRQIIIKHYVRVQQNNQQTSAMMSPGNPVT